MSQLTEDEVKKAFKFWHLKYASKETDISVGPFLNDQVMGFIPNQEGWLSKARKGLFLSAHSVAGNLKISRSAYSKLEENETKGSITLSNLAKAAEAMDCELVYAIRPKNKKYFSYSIWKKLMTRSLIHLGVKACHPRKRSESLAFIATHFMKDPKFRREQGWSQIANRKKDPSFLNHHLE